MKTVKNIALSFLIIGTIACDNGFEEMNVDPNTAAEATSAQLLTNAQFNLATNIGDDWNSGRMGMYYAQYWSSTYYSDESRYQIRENTNQIMWDRFYEDVLAELKEAQSVDLNGKLLGYENRIAISEILKAFTYHTISDIYGGPIPYSEALDPNEVTPKFNSGEEVYLGLLATLDEQVRILDETKPGFLSGDVLFNGNVAKWKKFANSLRLRIALRMIDAKPAEATEAIKKSLDPANGGVIAVSGESASFVWLSSAPNNNPINQALKTRADFSMSKPFIDYLNMYNDPRLSVFALPLLKNPNTYAGETYGIEEGGGNSNGDRTVVSMPTDYAVGAEAPTILLDNIEVKFMLAEIAARGLNVGLTGSAEQYYKEGIVESMIFAGITDATVINAYIKKVPYNAAKWKDSIGSQKWIGMYTQGIQGWLERMRLDFKDPNSGKAIFAIPADGSLDPDVKEVSTRMSYPVTEAALNGENYNAALKLLGGTNSKGARNWWDKY